MLIFSNLFEKYCRKESKHYIINNIPGFCKQNAFKYIEMKPDNLHREKYCCTSLLQKSKYVINRIFILLHVFKSFQKTNECTEPNLNHITFFRRQYCGIPVSISIVHPSLHCNLVDYLTERDCRLNMLSFWLQYKPSKHCKHRYGTKGAENTSKFGAPGEGTQQSTKKLLISQ